MKIGVIGLGKVGLVLAQVLRHIGGHEVIGYDVRPANAILDDLDAQRESMPVGDITLAVDIRTVVESSDVIYICVATPNIEYDATSPHGVMAEDFDYTALLDAVTAVSQEASKQNKRITLVVLSTVAPGTFAERIFPVVDDRYVALVYSPSFISLGTIEQDLLRPEAILIGTNHGVSVDAVLGVWHFIDNSAHRIGVSIESAEIIKMASNALQFFKIQYINALAELAERTYANIDEVSDSLEKVLNHGWIPRAGMPDGGACRPRDVAALLEIADKFSAPQLTALMDGLNDAHWNQLEHIAAGVSRLATRYPDLPILIVGDAYKAGVSYTDGSPGVALFRLLDRGRASLMPGTFTENSKFLDKAIYVIAVPFKVNLSQFPAGSVVYDVWGNGEDDLASDTIYISPGRTN